MGYLCFLMALFLRPNSNGWRPVVGSQRGNCFCGFSLNSRWDDLVGDFDFDLYGIGIFF